MKCMYCENEATGVLVWLRDPRRRRCRIRVPWCGCPLTLPRPRQHPYPVEEGVDYEVEPPSGPRPGREAGGPR